LESLRKMTEMDDFSKEARRELALFDEKNGKAGL
jgi:hypothetical protein